MQNTNSTPCRTIPDISKPKASTLPALITILGLTLASSVQAATITVTSASDEATPATACSLRGAVMAINNGGDTNGCTATGAYGSNDTILFAPALAGSTITFSSQIEIQKALIINGDTGNSNTITLDGNNAVRIFYITSGNGFTFKYLTLQNARARGTYSEGAAIHARQNSSSPPHYTVKIQSSSFKNNQAQGSGGAIFSYDYNLSLIIENSTFSNNSGSSGGAIWVYGQKTALITNSTFIGNRSTFSYRDTDWRTGGGAIFAGNLEASYLTLVDNQAGNGLGTAVFVVALSNINNSLIVSGPDAADGILCAAYVGFPEWYVHFSGNNNIEWRNGSNENSCSNTSPVLVPAGMTLEQIVSPTLADNGGPTQTLALPAGSPAIDAGSPFIAGTTDQRGESRPQGNGPDVGAFETASSLPDPRSYTHADVTTRVENGTTLTTINGQLISYPQHVGQKTAVFVFANAAGTNDWLLLNPVSGWRPWVDCNSTAFPYAMHESMPWVTDIALFYDADLSAFQGWSILFGYGVGNDETSACTDMLNNTRYAHIATL